MADDEADIAGSPVLRDLDKFEMVIQGSGGPSEHPDVDYIAFRQMGGARVSGCCYTRYTCHIRYMAVSLGARSQALRALPGATMPYHIHNGAKGNPFTANSITV